MLIRFRFSNFRSFKEVQELSLIASTLGGPTEGLISPPTLNERVLPVIAVYGANASGKSGVLKALEFMEQTVLHSHTRWQPDSRIPREAFAGDDESQRQPSLFSVDILIEEVRYQYGFEVDSDSVRSEWLYAYPNGKKQLWFSREQGKRIRFGSRMPGDNRTIEGLTRKNSLFLSAAAQNAHAQLDPIYRWFSRQLHILSDPQSFRNPFWHSWTAEVCQDDESKKQITELLSAADLGICDLAVKEEPMPDVMKPVFAALKAALPDASRLIPEKRQFVRLVHRIGEQLVPFENEQESAGTLAFLGLLGPIILKLTVGGILCVDELDSSLHPLMASHLVRLFNDRGAQRQPAQLIFNTHDTNILSRGNLRRDQIWFTEKDRAGASHLYPLTDFKTRKGENLESGYLQGRYGAIPFFPAKGFDSIGAQE